MGFRNYDVVVVPLLIRVQLFSTPWTAARQASVSFPISPRSLRLRPIESATPPTVPPLSPLPSCLVLWLHKSEGVRGH